MGKENRSFWEKVFGSPYPDEGELRVREYIIHRVREGAHLRDVLQEEYVQRNASQVEVEEILEDPALVRAAHEQLEEDLSSEELAPTPPPSADQ